MATIFSLIEDNLWDATYSVFQVAEIPISENKLIFANQGGPEPTGDYCVINVIENRQKGRTSEATHTSQTPVGTWEDQQLAFTTFYYMKVQFSFIGPKAFEYGLEFEHNINNSRRSIEAYQKKNLTPTNKQTLKRLPKLRETDWVESSVMDIDFGYSVQTYQDIDWIEYIIINGTQYRIVGDGVFAFDGRISGGAFGDVDTSTTGGILNTTGATDYWQQPA